MKKITSHKIEKATELNPKGNYIFFAKIVLPIHARILDDVIKKQFPKMKFVLVNVAVDAIKIEDASPCPKNK